MNDVINPLGFQVYQLKGQWYVSDINDRNDRISFKDQDIIEVYLCKELFNKAG